MPEQRQKTGKSTGSAHLFTSLEGTLTASTPPRTINAASIYIPAAFPAVACFSQPTAYGLRNPARFPMELISAIPAAAPVPARNEVGKLQNSGSVVRMPIVASVSPVIASVVSCAHTTE